jgi:hypothetical protein
MDGRRICCCSAREDFRNGVPFLAYLLYYGEFVSAVLLLVSSQLH